MKKCIFMMMSLVLLLSLAACGAEAEPPAEKPVMIANPYGTYETAEQMQSAAELQVSLPENLPQWVTETIYRAIPGELVEVIYKGESNEIRVRIKNGDQDISGVYDCGPSQEKDVTVGENPVHLKGQTTQEGEFLVLVSTWNTSEGRTYSVTSTEGVLEATLIPILEQIR